MADPDLFEFLHQIKSEEAAIVLSRRHGLIPAPQQVPPDPARPNHEIREYWGVCREINFNPALPACDGRVTTTMRVFKNGPKPQFRCVRCRKQLSQLHGMRPVAPGAHHGTWFASLDAAGKPNTKISKQAVMWIIYAMATGMSVAQTEYYGRHTTHNTKNSIVDCANYVRELFADALNQAAPMGGPGDIVEIDESLFRGKRKYNRGRVLLGNRGGAGGGGGAGGAGGGGGAGGAGGGGGAGGAGGAGGGGGAGGAGGGGGPGGAGGGGGAVGAGGGGGAGGAGGGGGAGGAGGGGGAGGAGGGGGAGGAGGGGGAVGAGGGGGAGGAGGGGGAGGAGGGGGAGGAGGGGGAVGAGGGGGAGGAGGGGGAGHRNHGRRVDGPWVFGMLLRRTGELRLVYVHRRDAATLLPLIRRHIAAGTTIHSDEWAAYRQIDAMPGMQYVHRTVNHQVLKLTLIIMFWQPLSSTYVC